MAAIADSKREKFAQLLSEGLSQRQAYLQAYPAAKKWKPETVDNRACKLAHEDEIVTRCEELKNASASDAILSRQGRMKILTEIATDKAQLPKPRMQAIDILNKMDGEYVKKIEATVSTSLSDVASKVDDILNE